MSEVELIKKIVHFLDEKKGSDIRVLDLRDVSSVSDAFILVTCTSVPHLKALFDGLHRLLKLEDKEAVCKTGLAESGWMILDIHGIMVHFFDADTREYYDLESLWKDALEVKIEE
jgi:ribosome-associated protein